MNWRERIEVNPKVLVGKPVVRGTRISADLVLEMISAGVPEPEILGSYPKLKLEDLRACVAYAADSRAQPINEASKQARPWRRRRQTLERLCELFEGHDAEAETRRLKEQDEGF